MDFCVVFALILNTCILDVDVDADADADVRYRDARGLKLSIVKTVVLAPKP